MASKVGEAGHSQATSKAFAENSLNFEANYDCTGLALPKGLRDSCDPVLEFTRRWRVEAREHALRAEPRSCQSCGNISNPSQYEVSTIPIYGEPEAELCISVRSIT